MRPRRLNPRFLEKVWGATRLEPWFRDRAEKTGEVWFHADPVPLLVKFLFTTENLSVQVHPGDEYARLHHNSPGKTEMWHVLAAEPGARIAAGFREPVGLERFKSAASSGEIENLLQWFEARPGDTFFIPAGTVHAIGGGLAMCEIQQHSDITYRLYDYGRARELHLDRGAAVSRLGSHSARVETTGEGLVSCEHFTAWRWNVETSRAHLAERDELLIILAGSASLEHCRTSAGDVWHLPPQAQIELTGNVTALLTRAGNQK